MRQLADQYPPAPVQRQRWDLNHRSLNRPHHPDQLDRFVAG